MASSSSLWKYHVFLSFRGDDTRKGFVSHLEAELDRKCIITFKDDKRLEVGSSISPALLQAIQNSRFSIIVISRNYASSSWCLDELVKIVECAEKGSLTPVPVFYAVDPSDVRKQTGCFAAAFHKHEENFRDCEEKVEGWRRALRSIAQKTGEDSKDWKNEAEGVKKIVGIISKGLFLTSELDSDSFVGMEAHIEETIRLLCLESKEEVRFVGIWGMGGVGKTTIARCLYNKCRDDFQACCFIDMSKSHGKRNLVEFFLSEILNEENLRLPNAEMGGAAIKARLGHSRVFVVFDSVESVNEMRTFASKKLYGGGSRIIIAARDKRLLEVCGVGASHVYEVKCMTVEESFQLFYRHAFDRNDPEIDFEAMSSQVVCFAHGLPLALIVLGDYLKGKSQAAWRSAVRELRKVPNNDVIQVLRISYDSLHQNDKSIFLLVVCFLDQGFSSYCQKRQHGWLNPEFSLYEEDSLSREEGPFLKNVVEACDYGENGIRHLNDKSLLKISSDGKIEMHDLLRHMGRMILDQQQKSRQFLSKHNLKEETEAAQGIILNVLDGKKLLNVNGEISNNLNEGIETAGGVMLDQLHTDEIFDIVGEVFEKMKSLRFFVCLSGGLIQILNDFNYLPPLKYLYWDNYPLEALPTGFSPEFLVELCMHSSDMEKLWEGTKPLRNLRILNLNNSRYLKELPDLSSAHNLEYLDVGYCVRLESLPGILSEKLKSLVLDHCKELMKSPWSFDSFSELEVLSLQDLRITMFPMVPSSLKTLNLSDNDIQEIPSWISMLTQLKRLDLRNNRSLKNISTDVASLLRLDLIDCKKAEHSVSEISTSCAYSQKHENLSSLSRLSMEGCCSLRSLNSFIKTLTALQELDLSDCLMLEDFPESIEDLSFLESINVTYCPNVTKFPNFPCNIRKLVMQNTSIEEVPSWIEKFSRLSKIDLQSNCCLERVSMGIFKLLSLVELDLSFCENLVSFSRSPGIVDCSQTSCLGRLSMHGCKRLKIISGVLENLTALETLDLGYCEMPEEFEVPTSIRKLRIAGIASEVPEWISKLSRLESLEFTSGSVLEVIPNAIFKLTSLSKLGLSGQNEASSLYVTPRFRFLSDSSLIRIAYPSGSYVCTRNPDMEKVIEIEGTKIEKIPAEVENFSGLWYLNLSNNEKLKSIPVWVFKLNSLIELYLSDCRSLERLPPDIPKECCLKVLDVSGTPIKTLPNNLRFSPKLMWLFAGNTALDHTLWLRTRNLEGLEMGRRDYITDAASFGCSFLSSSKAMIGLKLYNLNITQIPDDLGMLGRLMFLDLRGNDFEKIPTSIQYLSKLQKLNLNDCRKLSSLPALPRSLKELWLNGCISLEEATFVFNHKTIDVDLRNCRKLHLELFVKHMISLQFFKEFRRSDTVIVTSGTRVPEHFEYRVLGSTVTILSLRGQMVSSLVVCLVVTVEKPRNQVEFVYIKARLPDIGIDEIWARFILFGLESDNLLFFTFDLFLSPEMLGCDEISIEFEVTRGYLVKVKECGVHLIALEGEEKRRNDSITSPGLDFGDTGENSGEMDLDTEGKREVGEPCLSIFSVKDALSFGY